MSLAEIGIEVRLRGNGCIIKDRHSKTAIKASRLDRNFTKSKLEARLSFYQKSIGLIVNEKERYIARPLHKHRGELYAEYRAAISGRKKFMRIFGKSRTGGGYKPVPIGTAR